MYDDLKTFTRLTHPIALVSPDAESRHVDLSTLDQALSSLRLMNRDGEDVGGVWGPLPEKELKNIVYHLVSPVTDYFRGEGRTRPLVRGFSWSPGALDRLRRELVLEIKGVAYSILLEDIELFIFDTGVAFLAIEFMPTGKSIGVTAPDGTLTYGASEPINPDDIVQVNYALRTRGRQAGKLQPQVFAVDADGIRSQVKPADAERIPDDPSQLWDWTRRGGKFGLDVLVDCALLPLANAGFGIEQISSQNFLGFTFLKVKPRPDVSPVECYNSELAETLFRLRRMYSVSYRPASSLLETSGNEEVYQPFEGIYHGIAAEGGAVLVFDDGSPFFSQFENRYRRGYFSLFLLVIHQRAVLETLAIRASRIPNIDSELLETGLKKEGLQKEFLHTVRVLRLDAFNFTLHHTFPWVGALTMYQEVYERLLSRMRVRELHQDLRDDLREMDELMERVAEAERRGHAVVQERTRRLLEWAAYIVMPFMVIFAAWGMNLIEITGESDQHSLFGFWPIMTFIAALGTTVALILRLVGRRERKQSDRRASGE